MKYPDKELLQKINEKLKPKGMRLEVIRSVGGKQRTYPFELIDLATGKAECFYKLDTGLDTILGELGIPFVSDEWPEIIE